MSAADRWREDLQSWALPPELLAQAEEDPWALPVELFARYADHAAHTDTPSRTRALEALPAGGSVLDVGCGAGAASLALLPQAGFIAGVDESPDMLRAFAQRAIESGVSHSLIAGRWPDTAPDVEPADLVVCHHVFYNVQDLVPFAEALTGRARSRVVVEMTTEHPRTWTNPFFEMFHDLKRPERPTADDAVEVLTDNGVLVEIERWSSPVRLWDHPDIIVPFIRRALCLPKRREPEVQAALDTYTAPKTRSAATLWWPGGAR